MKRTNEPTPTQKPSILIEAIRSSNFLILNRTLIKKHGLENAAFLSFVIDKFEYYLKRSILVKGEWFYLTYKELERELGLTDYGIKKSKKYWKKLKVLDTEKRGIPAKLHYKINWRNVEKAYHITSGGDFASTSQDDFTATIYSETRKTKPEEKNNTKKENSDGRMFDVETDSNENEQVWNWFNEFWDHYPRKYAKQKARKSWEQLFINGPKKSCPTYNQVIEGIKKQAPVLAQREATYIPHASTWLNQKRWEDKVEDLGGSNKKTSKPASAHREPNKKYKTDFEI